MKITTIGIDLAKTVFQVHGVNARGKVMVRKALKRAQMAAFFANTPPCLIGMEACGSAHYWARKLQVDRDLERRPTRLLRIGVVMQSPANPFYEVLRQAFARANSLYFGASLQTTLYYFDVKTPHETAEMLRKIASSQDALIVILPDHQLITTTVQAISTQLPVVTMVSDLPQSGRMAYVGLDNRAAGRTAGELMGRFVGHAGGDIVVVSGLQSFIGQGEREMGFRAVLAERHPH